MCLHVREGGFFGDWGNSRNANVNNFRTAIELITKRGIWIVRMGDASMTRLATQDCVIDYAHLPSRNALMDVYLLKECSFFLGTSSGILDTAYMLGKPVVLTNQTQWLNVMPQRRGDFVIFKHVYSNKENRFISIQEWLQRASEITRDHLASPDWSFVENSEDEIADVVTELLSFNLGKGSSQLQQEFKRAHLSAMVELSKTLMVDLQELENCNDWFRFASRALTWEGDVSHQYLSKNWNFN